MKTVKTNRADERMLWLLDQLAAPYRYGYIVAWDADFVDAFVEAFPEAEATLRIYTVGANSSPMLNRAAKRAEAKGYLEAGRIGNMMAREYGQRTWCRTWSLTDEGKHLREAQCPKCFNFSHPDWACQHCGAAPDRLS